MIKRIDHSRAVTLTDGRWACGFGRRTGPIIWSMRRPLTHGQQPRAHANFRQTSEKHPGELRHLTDPETGRQHART